MPRTHGKYSVLIITLLLLQLLLSEEEVESMGFLKIIGMPARVCHSPSIVQISIQVLLGKPILTLGLTFLILSNEGF